MRLTDQEWLAAIRFLTATGHITGAVREVFIRLSDTLGLSSLVDLINHSDVESLATEPTILGPFYMPASPDRDFRRLDGRIRRRGQPAALTEPCGTRTDSRSPACARTRPTGFYAVQQPEVQPPTNLRGVYRTRDQGRYEIRSVRPVPYPIPPTAPWTGCSRTPDAIRGGRRTSTPGCRPRAFENLDHAPVDRDNDYLDSDTVFASRTR